MRLWCLFHQEVYTRFWKAIVNAFDTDKNGMIDPIEMSGIVGGLNGRMTNDEISALVRNCSIVLLTRQVTALDTDKNGMISAEELANWALSGYFT